MIRRKLRQMLQDVIASSGSRTKRQKRNRPGRDLQAEWLEDRSLLSAGAIDTSFGTNGIYRIDLGTVNETAARTAVQPDGKIVTVGSVQSAGNWDVVVARFLPDGGLDTNFGDGGKKIIDYGIGDDFGESLALQADGKILVAGQMSNGSNFDVALIRLTDSGQLDNSFGTAGKVATPYGTGHDTGRAVAVSSSTGEIYVAGDRQQDVHSMMIMKYDSSGSLVTSFGTGGKLAFASGSIESANTIVIQPSDGKVVISGYVHNGTNFDFAMARVTSAGIVDISFGASGTGRMSFPVGSANDYAESMVMLPDGSFVLAGYSTTGSKDNFAVAKVGANGQVDTSFGTLGKTTVSIGAGNDLSQSIIVQPDGKLLVAGFTTTGSNLDMAVVRLTAAGALDATFDGDGKKTIAVTPQDDRIHGMALQGDNKAILLGRSHNGSKFATTLTRVLLNSNPIVTTTSFLSAGTMNAGATSLQVTFDEPVSFSLGSQERPAASARQIKVANPSASDGIYWIDPDGAGPIAPFQVYCDMTSEGGGWMLAVNSVLGAEPASNDIVANTGTVGLTTAHTRNLNSYFAGAATAEIRHDINGSNVGLGRFHGKYFADSYQSVFTSVTTLSGHTNSALLQGSFGASFGGNPGGPSWFYNGNPQTTIPASPAIGNSGPFHFQSGQTLSSQRIWIRGDGVASGLSIGGAELTSNYELRRAGIDGLLGNSDDQIINISPVAMTGNVATLSFPALQEGRYRLTVKDTITNAAANALDGNLDGIAGGNWQRDFVVDAVASFTSSTISTQTTGMLGMVATDLNGDSNPDIVVSNTSGFINVALGNGIGGFGPVTAFATGVSQPDVFSVAHGQISGSSLPELVVGSFGSGGVRVMSNNGSGNFSQSSFFNAGGPVTGVAVGDLNGDGANDIVASRYNSASVMVAYLNSSGGLITSSFWSVGFQPLEIIIADLDGDGRNDIVSANAANSLTVLRNLGGGPAANFATSTLSSGGSYPAGLHVADFSGDGLLDLVTTNLNSSSLTYFRNTGGGSFTSQQTISVGSDPCGVTSFDFNRDGLLDIAVARRNGSSIQLLRNNGGTNPFVSDLAFNAATPFEIVAGDFDKDGRTDLAASSVNSSVINILLSTTNSAPTDLSLSSAAVNENLVAGAVVGSLSAVDPNTTDTHTFSLVSGEGALDNAKFSIVGNSLRTEQAFDFETQATYSIRIRVADAYGGILEKIFTINVSDVDEIPPTVTNASFVASGTLAANATSLTVTFSEATIGTTTASNYELRRAGANGLLGNTDDPIVTISSVTMSGNIATLNFAALPEDVYRLTIKDTITDAAGNSLDGDGNGSSAGNWRKDFVVGLANEPTIQTLLPSVRLGQVSARFGESVAVDGNLHVVGAPFADIGEVDDVGAVYVFNATTGALVATLANPTPEINDRFGTSVAIFGDTVVVGVASDDTGGVDSGSAYVFNATTGELVATLADPSPVAHDRFGHSVAISGNSVVVGTPSDDTAGFDCGIAYVFNATSGILVATLASPTPAGTDEFGSSVAISGNTVVVGDYLDGGDDIGSAYVFNATSGALVATLLNPTPTIGDQFGISVAISGNTVVVGANQDDTGASRSGGAYVFNATSGTLLATLSNPTPVSGDNFGYSVAISDNTVVVGAYQDDTGASRSGGAYVFNATTGGLVRTLANPTPAFGDSFGYSVAISGNTVVVGAYSDDAEASDSGSAYVFNATTAALVATLANPTPASGDWFGYSVAISDNAIVVGAFLDDTGGSNSGSAYVFNASTGTLIAKLNNPTPAIDDNFGNSVAISGNTVVVGSHSDDTGAGNSGSAYVFNATTGALVATLANPTPAFGDLFGYGVAISGNTVVVGAPRDDTGASDSGTAYVFNATTGDFVASLANPTPAVGDWFGATLAISGNTIVVGTQFDDTSGSNSGSAYVFSATNGVLDATLANPTPAVSDWFGGSVAILGNTVVVGALLDDTGASDSGTAYVFNATTGVLGATLANPTPAFGERFGNSVAISSNNIVVGSYLDTMVASGNGAAYVFNVASGALVATLRNVTPAASDQFGYSVASSGNTIVVGAIGDDTQNTDQGAAYLFSFEETLELIGPHGTSFQIAGAGMGAGQLSHGTGNAFDGLGRLRVADVPFLPISPANNTLNDEARTITTPTVGMSNLNVVREVNVPGIGSHDFARTVDSFTNLTGVPITVPVKILGNLGSDANTVVFATSDGDTIVEPTDLWFGTDDGDGSGTPAIIHLLHGPYGLQPTSVNVIEDNVEWSYDLTVPVGATKRLAHFTVLGTTRAQAIAAANALVTTNGFGGEAAAFLTTEELGSLVNFQFNTAPTDITISSNAIAENAGTNAVIGTLSFSDSNPSDTAVFSLPSGLNDNGLFNIAPDGITLRANGSFNFEGLTAYSVTVRVTDAGGLSFDKTLSIGVTNVNEAPTDISLSGTTVAETLPGGTVVGTFSTGDPDAGNTFAYALVAIPGNSDDASFTIVGNTLQTSASFNFEAKPSYAIRVRSTDLGGLATEKDFTITVTNVTELNGIDVQLGQTQRSYVRYLDVLFDQSNDLMSMINNGRLQLTKRDLNGNSPSLLSFSTPVTVGNVIRLDFGVNGLGGNRNTNAGDGYYELGVDMDGNGTFESKKYFHRLLGDLTGNGIVDSADKAQFLGRTGATAAENDVNGDGLFNLNDSSLLSRAIGRKLKSDLFRDD